MTVCPKVATDNEVCVVKAGKMCKCGRKFIGAEDNCYDPGYDAEEIGDCGSTGTVNSTCLCKGIAVAHDGDNCKADGKVI